MNYFCLGIVYFLCGGDLKLDAQTGSKLCLQSNSSGCKLVLFQSYSLQVHNNTASLL